MSLESEITLEHVACSFCGYQTHRLWRRVGNWTVVECPRCRFRFTNPRPTRASLAHFYTEAYFREVCGHTSFEDCTSPPLHLPADNYRVLDIEPWFEERGSLLEVGAGTGKFLKVMSDRGWAVRGLDISQEAVTFGRRVHGVDLLTTTLEEFDTSDRFDVVCMYHTLEHLPDPLGALRKARTWLRPAGVLVIEVPNADSFDARTSRREAVRILDLPRHLSHFTPRFLSKQLQPLGFDILLCRLYPPTALLNFLRWRERLRTRFAPSPHAPQFSHLRNDHSSPLPRLPADTWKSRFLHWLTTIAPGWRFTIVARSTQTSEEKSIPTSVVKDGPNP